ncbi:MAG: pesticin C-terminus-like muramidase [Acidobacteriota bacterium]|nr:pesticin C-terminus-like muramidase [Acidobacteriota bacterium]
MASLDPAAMKAINDELGTDVNFGALGGFEGGQLLNGYVPTARDGTVIGRSGVTICTGIDLGQQDLRWLTAMQLPADLEAALTPYLGLTMQAAVTALAAQPLLISRDEGNLLDSMVQKDYLESTMQSWATHSSATTTGFTDLTSAQQTVLLSRTYHQGKGMSNTQVAQPFYTAAIQGDWLLAETNLRNYNVTPQWYKNRVAAEAHLLEAERQAQSSNP